MHLSDFACRPLKSKLLCDGWDTKHNFSSDKDNKPFLNIFTLNSRLLNTHFLYKFVCYFKSFHDYFPKYLQICHFLYFKNSTSTQKNSINNIKLEVSDKL